MFDEGFKQNVVMHRKTDVFCQILVKYRRIRRYFLRIENHWQNCINFDYNFMIFKKFSISQGD
jgi:hypothetical protein